MLCGPGVTQWLRHCTTSWKVPGSIPGVAGVFSVASDSSMCPGVDSASKNEYQVNIGGKGGWCIWLTTYHLHVPMSINLGALTSWNPVGLFRPVMGQLYLLHCYVRLCVSPQFKLYYTELHIWGLFDDAEERVKHTNISINTWLTLLYEMKAEWVNETSRGAVEARMDICHVMTSVK
jgi:hypothetical protein